MTGERKDGHAYRFHNPTQPTAICINNCSAWNRYRQEGQHPLTGQRAANFRLSFL